MDPAVLRTIKIFASVSDDRLRSVANHVRELSVPEGARVVNQGDYATDLMAIIEGEADVVRDDATVAKLGAGDTFGEIGVIEGVKRTASVVATTPMRLIVLTGWDVKHIGLEAWFEIQDQMDQRELSNG